MYIIVIDGQGGKIGSLLVSAIKSALPSSYLTAIGTNSIATSTMLKAGADDAATGENPIIYNAPKADCIVGPIGIIVANSLLGEITPAIAVAVSGCAARKVLIPVTKCNSVVAGLKELPLSEYIRLAVQEIVSSCL